MEGVTPGGHPREDELIALYYECEEPDSEQGLHLAACAECRAAMERLKRDLTVMNQLAVPERGPEYERQLWSRLAGQEPALARRKWFGWLGWADPRPLALIGAVAALLLVAFVAGRYSNGVTAPVVSSVDAQAAQERVLAAALESHLASSERILLDVVNGDGESADWGSQRVRADALVDANRLYRLTAARQGQLAMAAVLEDLERVLIELAHTPADTQVASLQERITDQELVFKVRILQLRLREHPRAQQAERKG